MTVRSIYMDVKIYIFWSFLPGSVNLRVAVYPKWSISRQDELDWGAAGSCEFIYSSWSLNPISKCKYGQAQGFFMENWSVLLKISPGGWDWFHFDVFLKAVHLLRPSLSSCLEINHFRETATGNVNLEQNSQ